MNIEKFNKKKNGNREGEERKVETQRRKKKRGRDWKSKGIALTWTTSVYIVKKEQ